MTSYTDLYTSCRKRIAPIAGHVADLCATYYAQAELPKDIQALLDTDYGLNIERLSIPVNPYQVFRCDVPGIQSYLYFIINDVFYAEQSARNSTLPEGVIACPMREALARHADLVLPYLNKQTDHTDALCALNGMFAQDGFFLYVPDGVELDHPIQLINVMRSDVALMANAHNLIVIGNRAKAQLLVCDHTMDPVRFCANRITEVHIGTGAHYEHYKLEDTSENMCNLCTLLVNQQAQSRLLTNIITLRNGTTRNKITINQEGANAETTLCGMTVSSDKQSTDNYTRITHQTTGGKSEELFKYVLDGESKGMFTGELIVCPDAQKTEAHQTNRNILLSANARMRTLPQLEIYADDVRCSHGATTGQLDEAALFYMQQRCISPEEARMLLMNAFLSDVIGNIRIPTLQERIAALVDRRLRKSDTSCASCRECR